MIWRLSLISATAFAVMYLGQIVELADSRELCTKPLHPYTNALFTAALPSQLDERHEKLSITGEVPRRSIQLRDAGSILVVREGP